MIAPDRSAVAVLLLAVLCLPLAVTAADADGAAEHARVQGIRVHNSPTHTRLVIDADAPLDHVLVSGGPSRSFVLELPNLARDEPFDLHSVNLAASRLQSLRYSRRKRGAPRLLLDTRENLRAEAFALRPVPPYGHRLVVDLHVVEVDESDPADAGSSGADRDVIVAIDAGHGGEDPGALGRNDVHEADIVLSLARRVARRLERVKGISVVLVRDGDYYVALRKRLALARAARADLFVSIHADAFKDASVSGASVIALSSGGASSELSEWLAAGESRSDLIGGVNRDVRLADKDETLARVLLDLSLSAQINDSLHLADALLVALGSRVELRKRAVEQAKNLVVLKSPDIPSVIVEAGFMSNPAEARKLSQSGYQDTLAAALAQGIQDYVHRYPPPGTRVAQGGPPDRRHHVVAAGETLSSVAEQYGVSVRRIQRVNRMPVSHRLKIGQVLLIPGSAE